MDPFEAELAAHRDVLEATREAVRVPFLRLAALGSQALAQGGKILFCGNGGSAADAQHLAAELVGRYLVSRRALPSIALTTDSSILTAVGNDFGYDDIFVRQVEALARPGDLLVGISTSGNSRNVLKALTAAKAMGVTAAGFTGGSGGAMVGLADPVIVIPSPDTPRIQEMHILLGHMLCGIWEKTAL